MPQAKTLTKGDIQTVLGFIALNRNAERNRAMLMMTHLAGMRVGEVAALKIGDVWDGEKVKDEIRLTAEQTKGDKARTVFVPAKLRKELVGYLAKIDRSKLENALFATQKRKSGFDANTLSQYFHWLYKKAGIAGASSHSGRRTFITTLASKGVGVRVLMALAGHKSIQTTQCYIDCNDDMKRTAVELI